jgi:hypothetical protein
VISRRLEHTRTLQQRWRDAKGVRLVVRVLVAVTRRTEPDKIFLTNLDGGPCIEKSRVADGVRWPGFEMLAPAPTASEPPVRPHPWCLLVEDIFRETS